MSFLFLTLLTLTVSCTWSLFLHKCGEMDNWMSIGEDFGHTEEDEGDEMTSCGETEREKTITKDDSHGSSQLTHDSNRGCNLDEIETTLNVNGEEGSSLSLLKAHGHFWSLIGMSGIVFSACASFLVRLFTEAKPLSIFHSGKKRIKTLASIQCRRNNFSFFLKLLFHFCLTNTTQATSRDEFAWTTNGGLPYKDYCDVYSNHYRFSCLCANDSGMIMNNGKNTFYICDDQCDKYPFRVNGYCAQCAAGTFWGDYDTTSFSYTVSCPSSEQHACNCGITTHSEGFDTGYYFKFVCTHSADLVHPFNTVSYNSDFTYEDKSYYKGHCAECPAGTQSRQGDWVCVACEKGKYSSSPRSETCQSCPPGEYSDDTGFTYCKVCPAGYYSNNGDNNDGSTGCNECPVGYYAPSPGSSGCMECPADYSTNKATGATTCTVNTNTFSIEVQSTNRRRQLKKKEKKEKGSDDETEQAGKSGKGEMAAGLKELLQAHLGHCGGNTAGGIEVGIVGNALVQIGMCALGKKKNGASCDFHLAIPFSKDETDSAATKKEQAKSCIIATFQESDSAMKEALKDFFNSCDVTIKEVIADWKGCGLF